MKAIFIDALNQTVSEVNLTLNDYHEAAQKIGCQWIEVIKGLPSDAVLLVDEEAALYNIPYAFTISISIPGLKIIHFPIRGSALVVGLGGSEHTDSPLSTEEVQRLMEWLQQPAGSTVG